MTRILLEGREWTQVVRETLLRGGSWGATADAVMVEVSDAERDAVLAVARRYNVWAYRLGTCGRCGKVRRLAPESGNCFVCEDAATMEGAR